MTQILGVVTRRSVFHVSDRLLSQRTGSSYIPFDRNSNKSVIFCATDAHVVAAYTGRAYLDNVPTDTFIAQSMLGLRLSGNGGFYGVGWPSSWTDIGRSVERLRQCLSDAFHRLPVHEREADFQVAVLGWRQKRGPNQLLTPLMWELSRPPGQPSEPFQVFRGPRWFNWMKGYTLTVMPDLPRSTVDWLRGGLRQHGENHLMRSRVFYLTVCAIATRHDQIR